MKTNNLPMIKVKNWNNLFEVINSDLLYLKTSKKEYKEHIMWYVDCYFVDGSLASHSTLKTFTKRLHMFTQGTVDNYAYIKAHYYSSLTVDNLTKEEIERYKETINNLIFDKNKVTEKCNTNA